MRTQLTWVAQDQRLHPNHCRNGQHLVKQLGIGASHHDSGLAEPVRVHVGSVLRSGPAAPRPVKSVDDASSGLQPVDNASGGIRLVEDAVIGQRRASNAATLEPPFERFDLGPQQPVGSTKSNRPRRRKSDKFLLAGGPFHCVRMGVERTAR